MRTLYFIYIKALKVKVLGVVLDRNLSFDDHISAVIRRSYATLGGLTKMSHRLPEEVKQFLIESLVFPMGVSATGESGENFPTRILRLKIYWGISPVEKKARKP